VTAPSDSVDPLVAEFGHVQQARNGIPDDGARMDRRRCLQLLRGVLGDTLGPEGVAVSPLGVEWTDVFDAWLAGPIDPERLRQAGWLPLDRLIGRPGRGRRTPFQRWAVVEDGRVLAGLRFSEGSVDEVRTVLDRCLERSEVRLREVLELRELRRRGCPFPVGGVVLRVAAEIESGLGGRLLAPWATGRSVPAPAALPGRRHGPVIAISGVDGSGKSTLRAALADSLERAGLHVSTVWVRPGMGLGPLLSVAAWGKRLLGQDPAPGLHAMASPGAARPASRRGVVGWAWALLVTASFLVGVRRQHWSSRGVVLYDRHLIDALATLDFAYEGVDLGLQHRLVRALLPSADVRLYLDVPADVSVARKPDDVLGEHAVRRQLEHYARWLDTLPPAVRLDATLPTQELVAEALCAMTATHDGGRRR
jgi:thymidylate kinase